MKRPAHSVAGRSTTKETHIAPTLSRSAMRLLVKPSMQRRRRSGYCRRNHRRGADLSAHSLTCTRVRSDRADPRRSVVKANVPAGVESAHAAAGPGSALPASPGIPDARFRFGFLEFEDDPDARANDFQRCDRRPRGC